MRDELKRLRRLVAAQDVLVRLLESRLESEQTRLGKLQQEGSAQVVSLNRLVPGIVSYSTVSRRLSRLEAEIQASHGRIATLRKDLIKAKSSHDALRRQSASVAYGIERKQGDEETRDVSLAMRTTASHKDHVLD